MEKDGVLFDAPACFLFEASGDSESQHFVGDSEAQHSDAAAMSAEEEDAQSCNYGSLSGVARMGVDGGDDFRCADSDDCIGRGEEDGHGGSDLEDGVVDQCLGGRKASLDAAAKEKLKKSKGGCEDSSVKMMSERERDRLFWEACLASHK